MKTIFIGNLLFKKNKNMHQHNKNEDIMGKIIFSKYKPEKKLGEGSFGKIFVGVNINDGQQYALKMVTSI